MKTAPTLSIKTALMEDHLLLEQDRGEREFQTEMSRDAEKKFYVDEHGPF